jgi:hypothetical protein
MEDHMSKYILFIAATLFTINSLALTEQEYLLKNKNYTDGLLAFLAKEDVNNKQLKTLSSNKKAAESDLKKATSALSTTSKKLTQAESNLVSLKDKQVNKVQLESTLNNQKQQNQSTIQQLNTQIISTDNSLQNIKFEISQLENQKSLILQRVNTQKNLVDLAENNISRLQDEIRDLERDIIWNNNRINSLKSDNNSLQNQLNFTQDPFQKQQIQNKIQSNNNEIQQLSNNNSFAQNSISSKRVQLINEKSQLSQAESTLSSLNIQLNGKQNEINSQVSSKNQLENKISSLQVQKNNLLTKNKSIDAELDVLANLPFYIANTEQEINSLTSAKAQQTTAVTTVQNQVDSLTASLTQLQVLVDSNKASVLASEKEHDADLKTFMAEIAATPTPFPLAEGTVGIDSIVVSETLAQNKDWSVFKGSSATLNSDVCAASTRFLDEANGIVSELMVVKTINNDGTFSSAFVLTTHSMIVDFVVKGQLKTDKSKSILLPLLQSPVVNEKAVISRYSDVSTLISALKAHNTAKIEFTIPNLATIVPFSLKGSNAMINEFEKACSN